MDINQQQNSELLYKFDQAVKLGGLIAGNLILISVNYNLILTKSLLRFELSLVYQRRK